VSERVKAEKLWIHNFAFQDGKQGQDQKKKALYVVGMRDLSYKSLLFICVVPASASALPES
jgi:hypothetical protein